MIPLQTAKAEMPVSDDHVNALISLHNRTADALAGYEALVDKAEPSFKDTAEQFRALHATQAERLFHIISALGHQVDAGGTFMGTVNVAVVSLRAIFDSIDADVMDNLRHGEKSVLAAFDEAITLNTDPALVAELMQMRDALTALLDRTSALA